MKMDFYNNVSDQLKLWVNHYWHMYGELESDELYEILPMDHSDVIIRIRGDYCLHVESKKVVPSKVSFQGLKMEPIYLEQNDYTETLGISFKPWGLYPLVQRAMSEFQNKVVDVGKIVPGLGEALEVYGNNKVIGEVPDISVLESILLKHIKVSASDSKAMKLIQDYTNYKGKIDDFSKENRISRRRLERAFNKYVGVSPLTFDQIRKFESVSRELLYAEDKNLSDLTFQGNYYDQPHLTKQFKKYSRKTPKKFVEGKSALKSNIDFEDWCDPH